MSISTTQTIFGENKTILALAGELFQNVNVKVLKADVAEVDGKRILKAGTLLSKEGKIVDGTTITNDKAFGLVYREIDFTNSHGNENVPVTIFGFIKESILPVVIPSAAKSAMPMIKFL